MIRYKHLRVMDDLGRISSYGGATIAYDDDRRIFGVSVCSPRDTFSRKMGRALAKARLILAKEVSTVGCFGPLVLMPNDYGFYRSQEEFYCRETKHSSYILKVIENTLLVHDVLSSRTEKTTYPLLTVITLGPEFMRCEGVPSVKA